MSYLVHLASQMLPWKNKNVPNSSVEGLASSYNLSKQMQGLQMHNFSSIIFQHGVSNEFVGEHLRLHACSSCGCLWQLMVRMCLFI